MEDYIGEVIETSSTEFCAESCDFTASPALGSFVKVNSEKITIYGIVYQVACQSSDPTRRPVAFGKTFDQLQNEHPQIFELLNTYFSVLIIAYKQDNIYFNSLPPSPPLLHSFVNYCKAEEIRNITKDFLFLPIILSSGKPALDEIIVSAFVRAYQISKNRDFLVWGGKKLLSFLGNDYCRFKTIMSKISAFCPEP